jgi:purine nucleoside phosphorylase
MSKIKVGIIGGTGLDNHPGLVENRKETSVNTPYGTIDLIEGVIKGVQCVRSEEY